MKWFKFYGQDWMTDIKVMSMRPEDRLCFIILLSLASAADENGVVRNCDEETLIRLTHLPDDPTHDFNPTERARGCLERYKALRCVTIDRNGDVTVLNFSRRQETNLDGAERQKKYRERLKTKAKSRNKSDAPLRNDSNARLDKNRIEENRVDTPNVSDDFFNSFWSRYPRKTAKGEALKAWSKISVTPMIMDEISDSLEAHIKSSQWTRDNGDYVPHASTWLNQKRWQDEVIEKSISKIIDLS